MMMHPHLTALLVELRQDELRAEAEQHRLRGHGSRSSSLGRLLAAIRTTIRRRRPAPATATGSEPQSLPRVSTSARDRARDAA
jgi:hypothetical protein